LPQNFAALLFVGVVAYNQSNYFLEIRNYCSLNSCYKSVPTILQHFGTYYIVYQAIECIRFRLIYLQKSVGTFVIYAHV